MDDQPLRILYIDDDPDFLEIAVVFLGLSNISADTAVSGKDAIRILMEPNQYDAIISDYQMPQMDGITLLNEIRTRGIDTPFILFTGRGREEVVIKAIETGADYYVQKGGDTVAQFTELTHKIRQTVNQRTALKEKRELEEAFRLAFEGAHDAIFWADAKTGTLANCNQAAEKLIGMNRDEIIGKDHLILYPPDWAEYHQIRFTNAVANNEYPEQEVPVITRSGQEIPVRISYSVTRIGDSTIIQGIFYDISEKRKDQKDLVESENRFRALFDSLEVPTWEVDFSAVKNYFNSCRTAEGGSIRDYLNRHPEKIRYCMSLIRIIHINTATLKLFEVHTQEDAILSMISLFTEESWPVFGEQLIALDEGKLLFEAVSPVCDPLGKISHIFLRVTVEERHQETLSRVFVSYQSVTRLNR